MGYAYCRDRHLEFALAELSKLEPRRKVWVRFASEALGKSDVVDASP